MITYFHVSESTDASWNLAFEEYLLRNVRDGEIFLLWRNDRSVILGKNQVAAAEVDLGFARENGIRVYHRITGGGAVYHDLGNVNFSRIVDYDPESPPRLANLLSPIVNALWQMGLPAVTSSRNDLLVDGKKICGTAYAIDKGHAARTATAAFSFRSTSLFSPVFLRRRPKNSQGMASPRFEAGSRVSRTICRGFPWRILWGGSPRPFERAGRWFRWLVG